jgi:hypothetical protein
MQKLDEVHDTEVSPLPASIGAAAVQVPVNKAALPELSTATQKLEEVHETEVRP